MTDNKWQISIPYRDRSDSLAELGFDAGLLGEEDRAVTRHLVLRALLEGDKTTGDLLDRLEAADPTERRELLDDAREAAGLERSEDIDAREAFEARPVVGGSSLDGPYDQGGRLQGCAACGAIPMHATTGLPIVVADRKYWCPEHKHLAEPDDHLPPDDVAAVGPHFEWIPAPSVQRRLQAEDDRRREENERRRRDREAEAEAIRAARRRFEEQRAGDPYLDPPLAGIAGAHLGPGWPR
jgi:hypothetical protein